MSQHTTIFLSRHGTREDWGPGRAEWMKKALRPLDPQLATEGFEQVKELAAFYHSLLYSASLSPSFLSNHFILSSPLVRTLQTSTAIADALDMPICVEYGAMEWLSRKELPVPLPLEELKKMFPRIDTSYKSTMDLPPKLTESELHEWCGNAIRSISTRFKGKTCIIVTHAAPLIALARGLVGPEVVIRTGVCSVTKLVLCPGDDVAIKRERASKWVTEMNGYCDHLSRGEQFSWSFY